MGKLYLGTSGLAIVTISIVLSFMNYPKTSGPKEGGVGVGGGSAIVGRDHQTDVGHPQLAC